MMMIYLGPEGTPNGTSEGNILVINTFIPKQTNKHYKNPEI